MCDINLRNVDAVLKSELKIEAAQAGMTFKEYCVGLLSGALLRGFTVWNQDTMAKIAEGVAEAQRITKMKPIPFGVQQYDRAKHSPRCTCTTCKPPK